MSSTVSATTFPDFQLHSLGWKAFQDLCLTILQHQLGQAVQRYSAVKDGGRDGAFQGKWHPTPALSLTGETIVQCKFTNRPHSNLTKSAFSDEYEKAAILWRRRRRNNYVVITNYIVTGEFEEASRIRFRRLGYDNFYAFGYDWIAGAIQQSEQLRTLVPRLYGLGDLSQILDERWYDQTYKLLEVERDNLRKFVPTLAYRRAVEALNEHGFVLLLGAPAVGKTAIAATLTLASGDAWKCRPMKIEQAEQLRERWNPNEKQLFWIDDAFGTLHYDFSRSHAWNSILSWLGSIIQSGAKIILTSRDYIYERARRDLKQGAFPLLRESQVVIDAAYLRPEEREQILYNHVRLGDQKKSWRRSFKSFFDLVAQHTDFSPEVARRLGTRAFTSNLFLSEKALSEFVEKPEQFLRETIEGLSEEDRAALGAIFLRGGVLPSPIKFSSAEQEIISRLGGRPHSIPASLMALRGSFVRLATLDEQAWVFKHPTIGDAFAAYVADEPELVDLYISGAFMDRLLNEVTCGVVPLRGVKLVVPSSRFSIIIRRLHRYRNSRAGTWEEQWRRRSDCDDFLATRCSSEFLRQYIDATPTFWNSVLSFNSYLSAVSEFSLLVTLEQHELLTPERRETVLRHVKDLAVETPDSDFLTTERIRRFFSDEEVSEIMDHVRKELIPNLGEMVRSWDSNFSRTDDAESYFSALTDAFRAFMDYFSHDQDAVRALSRATDRVDMLVADYSPSDDEDDNEYNFDLAQPANDAGNLSRRRIFDDLDA